MDGLAQRRRSLRPLVGSARSAASIQVLPQGLFNAPLGNRPHRDNLPALCRRDHPHIVGGKWMEVAPIFRLLAPTSLVFALANPLSWLVMSTGRVGRAVSITAAATPVVILGIVLGLSHGPLGVAIGYSGAMVLIIIPIAAWSKHGTGITWSGLWAASKAPLLAGLLAGSVGLIARVELGGASVPIATAALELERNPIILYRAHNHRI